MGFLSSILMVNLSGAKASQNTRPLGPAPHETELDLNNPTILYSYPPSHSAQKRERGLNSKHPQPKPLYSLKAKHSMSKPLYLPLSKHPWPSPSGALFVFKGLRAQPEAPHHHANAVSPPPKHAKTI